MLCRQCRASIEAGTETFFEWETKTILYLACATNAGVAPSSGREPNREGLVSAGAGIAGSSARRKYLRRKTTEQEKLREKWGASVPWLSRY